MNRSNKQSEAAHNNGTKSKGPVTEQGKKTSAQNAVRHNLCPGNIVLLTTEDPEQFHILTSEYFRRFLPADGVEASLVQKLIAADWRQQRILAMESALFELEMLRQREDIDAEYDNLPNEGRQVLALLATEDTKSGAALLLRYGAAARREYNNAFKTLRELQGPRFQQGIRRRLDTTDIALDDHTHEQQPPAAAEPQPEAPQTKQPAAAAPIVIRHKHQQPQAENTESPNEPEPPLKTMAATAATPYWEAA